MIEYSDGYREKAQEKLKKLERTMTEQARAVAKELSADFEKSSTKVVHNE